MRRPIAAVAAAATALWLAAATAAQSFTDVTPADAGIVVCPADLGGGAGLTWQRFGKIAGRETLGLAAAGLDPARPPVELVPLGGCPATATAPSGASLIAINLTGLTDGEGEVLVVDRAADGTSGAPLRLSANKRAEGVTAALASSGAAIVAWQETTDAAKPATAVHVAVREAGGAFVALGTLGTQSAGVAVGIDEAGHGIAVWSEPVPGVPTAGRLVVATRAPGAAFSAPRTLGTTDEANATSLVVGPTTGDALFAVSDDGGVRVATGTTRTQIGALRELASDTATGVTAALSANGAAAVAWLQPSDENAARPGVAVSDRLAGGDFGVPHGLTARGTRLSGNDAGNLRLAAAPDGRVIASWAVPVSAGDSLQSPVPVAALRRADGGWGAAMALAAPCFEQIDAFGGFDAAGRPRVTFVDTGLVSGGDFAFPYDTRIRVARLDPVPATPVAPPKVTISANSRQVLRNDRVRLRVRCERACDAIVFAVIDGHAGTRSGLFPGYLRLPAKRSRSVALEHQSYFADGFALQQEGSRIKVRLVAHACDSAGRIARARRTISLRIPRRTRG